MRAMATAATPRRTQRERSAATTAALLAAARERFAADGYSAASLNAIAATAGMTKGAVYHHFAGKEELFAAVYDLEQRRLVGLAGAAMTGAGHGPAARIEAACLAYLDAARDPGARRITLVDAPLALGATTLRSTPMLGLLERALAGYPGDGGALAQLLHGALREAAHGETPALAAELRALLRALPYSGQPQGRSRTRSMEPAVRA
jgi:AcrR family transcriptional regulator